MPTFVILLLQLKDMRRVDIIFADTADGATPSEKNGSRPLGQVSLAEYFPDGVLTLSRHLTTRFGSSEWPRWNVIVRFPDLMVRAAVFEGVKETMHYGLEKWLLCRSEQN